VNIVFFGSPKTARICLERITRAGMDVGLVVTQPDRPSGRGKRLRASEVKLFAQEHGIPLLQSPRIRKDPDALALMQKIRPDLNVVVAYGQIIPAPIIYLPEFNSINLHFSLLPAYRGAAPVQWALMNGEEQTGLTIFELNEKMDEGPILSQQQVPVLPEENARELEDRLAEIGADLLVETIGGIRELVPRPQDHSRASYAPLIKKQDGRLDWNRPSRAVDCHVRAFQPWPSTYTFLAGKRIKILQGKLPESPLRTGGNPGQVHSVTAEGIDVVCGDGRVFRILRLQPENKPAMSAHAFSLGAGLQPGTCLD
jgi:methionyl-tRNA formyltransferase